MRKLLPTKISLCLLVLLQAYAIVSSHKSGYISIDCGAAKPHQISNISYDTDEGYIATGANMPIDPAYLDTDDLPCNTVRSFPDGERNCYTLRPQNGKDNNYLIRAMFKYGNYDGKNSRPVFDLYIGVNLWDTMVIESISGRKFTEIIHRPTTDFIYVCLVNTGSGTPFISELVLRPLDDSLYNVSQSASLVMQQRFNTGLMADDFNYVSYPDDVYDRLWSPLPRSDFYPGWETFNSTNEDLSSLINDAYKLPPVIFRGGARPPAQNHSLCFFVTVTDAKVVDYYYLHFADAQKIANNESREFNIFVNGSPVSKPINLRYLEAVTVASPPAKTEPAYPKIQVCINQTKESTLPPILNAMEMYQVTKISQSATNQEDVHVMMDVKAKYGANKFKSWQGDPCLPKIPWDGLNCSDSGNDSPRIISLNLASRSLRGEILPSILSLKSLNYLNLSNNDLIGAIPEFLADMPSLRVIDLSGNKLSRSVPAKLTDRVKNGSLSLRLDGSPDLSANKNHNKVVIAVATASALLMLLVAVACVTNYICRSKWKEAKKTKSFEEKGDKSDDEEGKLDLPLFAFDMILDGTNNFADFNKLGEGGFGPVYKGVLEGGQEIAVKRLSHNSRQGQKEFKNEVKCIAKLQHRNLVKLIGYCNEKEERLLIYEFLPNKSLDFFIFDNTGSMVLDWPMRFEIIYGVARGLVYLHQDSRMRIIHRDLKASNILLDCDMKPKISDFGMARMFDGDQSAAQTRRVIGTYGYMPPEYAVDGIFSTKSDVFSFGVLVLEIVSGQRNRCFAHTDDLNLLGHAWRLFMEVAALEIVDRSVATPENAAQILRTIQIGLLCVQEYAEDRPNMPLVTMMLTGDSKLPSPKQPGFYVRRQVVNEESASLSSDIGSSTTRESITILSPR